jgi:beta-lactamase superfamily II metal-dependent hydrolase
MRKILFLALGLLTLAALGTSLLGQGKAAPRTLDIYYVDVEGGAATLIVTPAGESILVDAGWPGFDGRDAKRIQRAMQRAGITAIDHFINTHYHVDHYGGVPEIARLVTIKRFYDHGPMPSLEEDKNFPQMYAAYRAAAKDKTTTLKPGDRIQLKQVKGLPPLSLVCVAAAGKAAAPSGKAKNLECESAKLMDADPSDNARSVAFVLRYGDFDFFDAGDLTWNVEQQLACPSNQIGEIDLYQVTHHGMNISNNTALLRSLKPTVAIMNNGARKGGHPDTVKRLRELPSLKALYQVHRNVTSTDEQNAPAEFIANLDAQNDQAHGFKVAVNAAAHSYTVTNERTGASQSYAIK